MSCTSEENKLGTKLLSSIDISTADLQMEDILISESQASWMEENDSQEDTEQSFLWDSDTIDYSFNKCCEWSNIQRVQMICNKSHDLSFTSPSQISNDAAVSSTTSRTETTIHEMTKEHPKCLQSPSLYSDSDSMNSTLESNITNYVVDFPKTPTEVPKETDREIQEYVSSSSLSSSPVSPKLLSPASTVYHTALSSDETGVSPIMKSGVAMSSPQRNIQVVESPNHIGQGRSGLKLNKKNKTVSEKSKCHSGRAVDRVHRDFPFLREERNEEVAEYDIPSFVMDCPEKPIPGNLSDSPIIRVPSFVSAMYHTSFSLDDPSLSPVILPNVSTLSSHRGIECKLRLKKRNKGGRKSIQETTSPLPECSSKLDKDSSFSKEGTDCNNVGFHSSSTKEGLELSTQCSPLSPKAQEKFDIVDKCLLSSLLPAVNRLTKTNDRVLRTGKASHSDTSTMSSTNTLSSKDVSSTNALAECKETILSVSPKCKKALSSYTNEMSDVAKSGKTSRKDKSSYQIKKSPVQLPDQEKSIVQTMRSLSTVNVMKHNVRIKMIPRKRGGDDILEIKPGDAKVDKSSVPREVYLMNKRYHRFTDCESLFEKNKLTKISEQTGDSPRNKKKLKQVNAKAGEGSGKNEHELFLLPQTQVYESQGFVPSLSVPQLYSSKAIQDSTFDPQCSTQPFVPVLNNVDNEDKECG